ncbi:hypothetical protein DL768_001529 [Monosporascus sp. mg162]|nr:hypothetical protein DL768_001529 [Monosporascus sp. mg162]
MADIDVERILKGKYPAKAHAKRVAEYIRSKIPDASGIIYLEGRADALLEDSDEPIPFRQRRAFFYLTGVDAADCYLIYDMSKEHSTLFIPPVDPDSVVWSGLPLSPEEALIKYDVDSVLPSTELNPQLARLGREEANNTVFAIPDRVSDAVTFIEFGGKDFDILGEAVDECRVIKDDYEIALIRKANVVSGAAHRAVLESVRKASNEYELEGVFIGECLKRGAKKQAYPSIVAAGRAAATLHYVHNDKDLAGKELLLLDAGAEWQNYAADITRTFPISGKFTQKSRAIYDIVLKMQTETIAELKDGVSWDDVHLLAHKIAIDGLLALGILKGDREEILRARTSAAFLPHGLGHYLGLDTHDTGGHPNYADADPLFRYLRVRGNLPAGSVITVEPGIYFCEFIIRPYLKDPKHAQFIDEKVLDEFWDVGGIRIEDNILITKDGSINLTDVVKDPEELEKIISGVILSLSAGRFGSLGFGKRENPEDGLFDQRLLLQDEVIDPQAGGALRRGERPDSRKLGFTNVCLLVGWLGPHVLAQEEEDSVRRVFGFAGVLGHYADKFRSLHLLGGCDNGTVSSISLESQQKAPTGDPVWRNQVIREGINEEVTPVLCPTADITAEPVGHPAVTDAAGEPAVRVYWTPERTANMDKDPAPEPTAITPEPRPIGAVYPVQGAVLTTGGRLLHTTNLVGGGTNDSSCRATLVQADNIATVIPAAHCIRGGAEPVLYTGYNDKPAIHPRDPSLEVTLTQGRPAAETLGKGQRIPFGAEPARQPARTTTSACRGTCRGASRPSRGERLAACYGDALSWPRGPGMTGGCSGGPAIQNSDEGTGVGEGVAVNNINDFRNQGGRRDGVFGSSVTDLASEALYLAAQAIKPPPLASSCC